jgi:hypothetical protein
MLCILHEFGCIKLSWQLNQEHAQMFAELVKSVFTDDCAPRPFVFTRTIRSEKPFTPATHSVLFLSVTFLRILKNGPKLSTYS